MQHREIQNVHTPRNCASMPLTGVSMTPLNLKISLKNECQPALYLKTVCTTHTRTHTLKQLMLCSELIAVCYEANTILSSLCGQKLEFFNVKTSGTYTRGI